MRDIIHVTALDFRHYYDKFTSVMTPRKKSLSIFLCFGVGYSVSAGRWQQVKLTVAGVDDVLFGPTGSELALKISKCAPVEFRGGMITYCRFVLALRRFVLFPVRIPIVAFFFFFLE